MALLRLDGSGAILDANDTFRGWLGDDLSSRDVRGIRLSALLSVGGRIYWETHLAPLLRIEGRVEEIAVELRAGGTPRPVLLSAELHTVEDETDPDDVVVNVALFDARERSRFERELVAARAEAERSAASLRTLLVTTTALARAAGVEGVCAALVHAVVEVYRAGSASVWLVDDVGALTLRARLGDGVPERPSAELVSQAAGAVDADGTERVEQVVVAPDGHVVVPLRGSAALHGVLVIVPRAHPGDDALDHGALVATGQQGGVALDRAVLHEQSVSVAHELQRAMLTERLPQLDHARISTDYRPAERSLQVGGDWYDAFWVDDTTLALTVGDVVGHGLRSATAMGQLRTAVRSCAEGGVGPAGVLGRVDRFVRRSGVGFGSTLVYGELDVPTARFTYACAGHLPPLVTRPGGDAELLWEGRRMPLGVGVAEPEPGAVDLAPGDTLWLYTDGLVERRDRSLHRGLEVFAQAAAGTPGTAGDGELVSSLLGGDLNEFDDACVLRVEWDGPAPA
ncbi:SpoIIE family protein phosphatase [Promicromonospora sukumoe]|uniref:SpoIIE family protein phosphatase n=1 Tax=Promicromonospora sukumoe TaxID=88382 RepID=UPI0003A5F7CC|nr:SpoIIE family protein phosphatase [Promicromonospora sukumoe]